MQESVIVSHCGARFEIGRGPGYYAIWPAGATQWRPIEWWPETAEGWQAAWARFTDVEPQRAIHPVLQSAAEPVSTTESAGTVLPGAAADEAMAAQEASSSQPVAEALPGPATEPAPGPGSPLVPGPEQPIGAFPPPAGRTAGLSATLRRAGRPATLAAGLLAAGIAIGIAGLFPGYFGGAALTGHADQLAPHLIYLAAWAGAAVLIVAGGVRQRTGALLAAGTSLVTFGFFLADLGTGIAGAEVGAGLVLSLIGWAGCTAGSVLAVRLGAVGAPGKPRNIETTLTMILAAVAALGTAIAFAPSWDSFTLRTAAGTSQTITAGNAFANPGLVIAGDVLVMIAVVAIVVAAAAWRPIRLGAALLAGAVVPMAAQAISAAIQIGGATSSLQFGIPPGQAARLGLTISAGLTPAFWVYCAFVFALILTAALMASTPAPPPPPPAPVPARPAQSGLMPPTAPAVS